MSKQQYTPIPWHSTEPDGTYHDVVRIYPDDKTDQRIPIAICPQRHSDGVRILTGDHDGGIANAERIVRAVNCHDELVDALETIKSQLKNNNDHLCMIEAIENIVDKAITKAERGTQ